MSKYGLSAETLRLVLDAQWNNALEMAIVAVERAPDTTAAIANIRALKREVKE